MFKRFLLTALTAVCICFAAGQALAASAFDGKWYLDPDKMAENDPEYAALKDNPEIWEQVKAEMGRGGIELNIAQGEILETFDGTNPTPAKIKIISETADTLRIEDGGGDVLVLKLIGPKELTMSLEGVEEEGIIYFKR